MPNIGLSGSAGPAAARGERRSRNDAAERAVAAVNGEQHADVVEQGPGWDMGAPLPHLIADGMGVYIVCHARACLTLTGTAPT